LSEQMEEDQQFRARHDRKKTDHFTRKRQDIRGWRWYQNIYCLFLGTSEKDRDVVRERSESIQDYSLQTDACIQTLL
jgi:hypothetical protein